MSDVLIRVSMDLLANFGIRTDDGRKVTITLGAPVEVSSGEPVYEPVLTAFDDGMVVVRRPPPLDDWDLRKPGLA